MKKGYSKIPDEDNASKDGPLVDQEAIHNASSPVNDDIYDSVLRQRSKSHGLFRHNELPITTEPLPMSNKPASESTSNDKIDYSRLDSDDGWWNNFKRRYNYGDDDTGAFCFQLCICWGYAPWFGPLYWCAIKLNELSQKWQ